MNKITKRTAEETVKLVNELFDELAHNNAINIATNCESEYDRYLLERLYYCLYNIEEED